MTNDENDAFRIYDLAVQLVAKCEVYSYNAKLIAAGMIKEKIDGMNRQNARDHYAIMMLSSVIDYMADLRRYV